MINVGSWQFFIFTLLIVVIIFGVCHVWDKYDEHKNKMMRNRSRQ